MLRRGLENLALDLKDILAATAAGVKFLWKGLRLLDWRSVEMDVWLVTAALGLFILMSFL